MNIMLAFGDMLCDEHGSAWLMTGLDDLKKSFSNLIDSVITR